MKVPYLSKLQSNPLVVAIIAAVIASLVLSPIGLSISGVEGTFSTDTIEYTYPSFTGADKDAIVLKGHIELSHRYGEPEYATAFETDSGDVLSEGIYLSTAYIDVYESGQVINGAHIATDDTESIVLEYWYEVYVNGALHQRIPDGSNVYHHTGPEVWESGQWERRYLQTPPQGAIIMGPETGNLQVILKGTWTQWYSETFGNWVVAYKDHAHTNRAIYSNQILSEDGARLTSGNGMVMIDDDSDVVEEGSNVEFMLETGFTHSQGWTVEIIHPTLGVFDFLEDGFIGQDNFGPKMVTYTIPSGWFTPSGNNEIMIRLSNQFWPVSKVTFFTVDDLDLIPTMGGVSWSTSYVSGSAVTVNAHGVPNENTNSSIDYFRVYVYYGVPGSMPGSVSEYIINGASYQADSNGHTTFSFTLFSNRGDQCTLKINPVDEDGRAGYAEYLSMDVINPLEDGDGGGDENNNVELPFIWSFWTLVVAAMTTIAFIGIILFWPGAINIRIILAVIAACIGALFVYLMGTGAI